MHLQFLLLQGSRYLLASALLAPLLIAGCGEAAKLSASAGFGTQPALPPPQKTFIPTVNIAPAQPWIADDMPTPADGLAVNAFMRGLDHPRWIYVLPNGDVLVAETNAPP